MVLFTVKNAGSFYFLKVAVDYKTNIGQALLLITLVPTTSTPRRHCKAKEKIPGERKTHLIPARVFCKGLDEKLK